MKILKVIPKTKIGLNKPQALTYFSKENVKAGGIVLIKIRNRRVMGVVADSTDLKNAKMSLRKGEKFSLKAIDKALSPLPIFNEEIIELIHWTSRYYFESEGIILKNALPDVSQKKWKNLSLNNITEIHQSANALPDTSKDYYTQLEGAGFEKLLEEYLKKKRQCLVLYPEIAKLSYELGALSKELRRKTVVFNSDIKKDELWENWQRILSGEALVIFATRQGVFLPFRRLGLVIVQDESSFSHKSWDQHPKYNAKHVALKLSELHDAKVIFSDPTPSLESYANLRKKKYELKSSEKIEKNRASIIDMGQMIDSRMKFSYISPRLKTEIHEAINKKGKILLFQNRRGLATYIFCKDCGYYYSCPNCDFSLVYHKQDDKLVCHWCNHKEGPPKVCRKCKGTTIKYSGHGTQKILEEVTEAFPGTKITVFDYDSAPTTQSRLSTRESFLRQKEPGIMIATSIILAVPEIQFDLSAVLNYDLLVNFPDYQTNERIVRLIARLKRSTNKLYLQSYNVKDPLLLALARGLTGNIYRKELLLRQDLYYPPFWHFLSLKYAHKNEEVVEKEAKKLYNLLTEQNKDSKEILILGPISPVRARMKGKFARSLIIKSKKRALGERNKLLLKVPSKWDVDVDPIEI